jgi:hypothetical protein
MNNYKFQDFEGQVIKRVTNRKRQDKQYCINYIVLSCKTVNKDGTDEFDDIPITCFKAGLVEELREGYIVKAKTTLKGKRTKPDDNGGITLYQFQSGESKPNVSTDFTMYAVEVLDKKEDWEAKEGSNKGFEQEFKLDETPEDDDSLPF